MFLVRVNIGRQRSAVCFVDSDRRDQQSRPIGGGEVTVSETSDLHPLKQVARISRLTVSVATALPQFSKSVLGDLPVYSSLVLEFLQRSQEKK